MPWIGIKDATANYGRVIADTFQHTNELGISNSSARILPANTVCLSRTASVGYVVVMGKAMATSQDFVNWVCSDALDWRFLKYVLLAERSAFLRFASGTTHQTIYFPEVKAFHVCLPPLPEQRAIAHILGALDDKIELNRRMNETLEAMARALYKSWFVDFDPVRAKTQGRGSTLPSSIFELFPSEFVQSEVGRLPMGWSIAPLRELATSINRGIGPSYVESGGIRVLNQKCIRAQRVEFARARRHSPSDRVPDSRLLRNLDVLVNSTGVGTLGRTALLKYLTEPTIVDSHITVVRPSPNVDPYFLGLNLTSREEEIEGLGEGTTGQTELSRARLGDLSCLVPPRAVQACFGQVVGRLVARASRCEREVETLSSLRDELLPRLLSGDITLGNSEAGVRELG